MTDDRELGCRDGNVPHVGDVAELLAQDLTGDVAELLAQDLAVEGAP